MSKEILNEPIDVIEHKINRISPALLKILLKDNTTKENLKWATSTYEKFGYLYAPERQMLPEQMIGPNMDLLTPRVSKTAAEQQERTKEKGEVFTPAWCCNMMNNFLDEDWFERKNVFNKEIESGWKTNKKKITFSKKLGKTWQEYVTDIRMEITCGEAPYLCSRYDVVKGEIIPVEDRIGLLDRKLRVINENTDDEETWLEWAEEAYKATYGYDYQGDNVLIARENLLYTLVDNMVFKFGHQPDLNTLKRFATIISWNIWQMDGLDHTVPFSEREAEMVEIPLFDLGDEEIQKEKTPVKIKNWETNKTIEFKELTKGDSKMKFNYIVGNPPYQGQNHMQLYPDFYLQTQKIGECVELIFPIGWQEPKKANNLGKMNTKEVKEDKQIVFINNIHNAFPTLKSVEWTNIIMWKRGFDNGLDGNQKLLTNGNDEQIIHLFTEAGDNHISEEMKSVLKKVKDHPSFVPLSSITLRSESYRFTEKMHKEQPQAREKLSKGHDYDLKSSVLSNLNNMVFFDQPQNDGHKYIEIMGLSKAQRVSKWIREDYIQGSPDFNKYKLFVAEAAASGKFGERLSETVIAKPKMGHTQTFISIGSFDTEIEAINTAKYIKTKFARALLFTLKTTQHNGVGTWMNIPIQNFTSLSDIDWSKSVTEIDQQLYKKYNLTQEEIEFIESHVKEME